ncbi:hypothetical protein G7Y89_g1854 [Cudoniella acicularis]|uniref:Uncharacterized protein n=1 Tax=Cudoniella acicularis TaxID=354080 RepID=A0A8H4RW70_9HELO|nr:hypothetical protein G7Y89_g1854 [Cudoniella acicularis]
MFFHLEGVLIASSNRMPDELAKASGMDFAAPSRGGFMRKMLGFNGGRAPNMFPANNEYAEFVDVLKASAQLQELREKMIEKVVTPEISPTGLKIPNSESDSLSETSKDETTTIPKKHIVGLENEQWDSTVKATLSSDTKDPIP